MINDVLAWLRSSGFPELEPEYLGPREGDMGLFCQGREVLWQRRDILGVLRCRQKVTFRVALRSRDPEGLDAMLTLEPALRQTAPGFGSDQRLLVEKGRTVRNGGSAPAVLECNITLEFTTKEE